MVKLLRVGLWLVLFFMTCLVADQPTASQLFFQTLHPIHQNRGTAMNLFFEYLLGTTDNVRYFGDGNLMTEGVKRSTVMNMRREDMRNLLRLYCIKRSKDAYHAPNEPVIQSLGGELGDVRMPWSKYLFSEFPNSFVENQPAAFTGSFSGGDMRVIKVDCCRNVAKIHVHAINISSFVSNFRKPPELNGYSGNGEQTFLDWLFTVKNNPFGPHGPFNNITQIYDWDEFLKF